MSSSQRDAGLVRVIGPFGMGAAIVNNVIGAGIFALPAAMAHAIGPYAPLAFLFCALIMGGVVICFAEAGSRVPTSGGAYGYVEAAFGRGAGFVSGVLIWMGGVLALGGIAAALADTLVTLLPAALAVPAHALLIVLTIGGIAAVNIRGAAAGTRFVGVVTLLKVLPLLIFIGAGVTAWHSDNLGAGTTVALPGFGRAMILALFAFSGMETPLSASGEVAQPERNIPRALFGAMLFVTVVYCAVQLVAQAVLGAALADAAAPLAAAMGRVHPALQLLLLGGAALSMFGWMGTDVMAMPRMLFAFARDGFLPAALGRLHPRSHAPQFAIMVHAGIGMLLALTGTFAELVSLSALASAALYILGCAAAWTLRRRNFSAAGTPVVYRGLSVAAVVGIAGMTLLIALSQWHEILGLVVLIGASVALYAFSARRGR